MTGWGFYGRAQEQQQLRNMLQRGRWYFGRITGRRRIGKMTLVEQTLRAIGQRPTLYVQIPDSAPAGVLSAVRDALETFGIPPADFSPPTSLHELAQLVGRLAEAGFVVALDEFQYFSRKHLFDFTSHLQAVVDGLSSRADRVPGGLLVLGSIHTELVALLEDRTAPLYNRTTDHIEVDHLDIASVLAILRAHADDDPRRLLFLWNLFEGVPKFYRDCFEQGVLGADRAALLEAMFFRSSSPLRSEADNWFLSELRGRYDVILKHVARRPGCSNADLLEHVKSLSPGTEEQVGGYLKVLLERYRMIERRLPIFAAPTARKGRYYLRDNFLRAWLSALASPVGAANFRPVQDLVATADARLADAEGFGLERLAARLYEERSRKGLAGFRLTHRIDGYWDRGDIEIDLVALDEDDERIRFGTCRRAPERLPSALDSLDGAIERFMRANRRYEGWTIERAAITTSCSPELRALCDRRGVIPQDLRDLTLGL